jgi:hypothetical protein
MFLFGVAKPLNWIGPPVEVGEGAVPLSVVLLGEVRVKFAQVMRVLFPKWTAMDRLPKKAPSPGTVVAKSSMYEATKGSEAIFPYLPERSPT